MKLSFSPEFLEDMRNEAFRMQWDRRLVALPARDPLPIVLGSELSRQAWGFMNKGWENTVKMETVFQWCEQYLQPEEELKGNKNGPTRLRLRPVEEALDKLVSAGILHKWEYVTGLGEDAAIVPRPVTYKQAKELRMTWAPTLMVDRDKREETMKRHDQLTAAKVELNEREQRKPRGKKSGK